MTLSRRFTLSLYLFIVCLTACTGHLYKDTSAKAIHITATATINPVLKNFSANPVLCIRISIPEGNDNIIFNSIQGSIQSGLAAGQIERLEVFLTDNPSEFSAANRVGSLAPSGKTFKIPIRAKLAAGTYGLWLNVILKGSADIDETLTLKADKLTDDAGHTYLLKNSETSVRPIGIALRKENDDGVRSYRIPGMITTDKGTLISVYDIRHNHSGDLPANIDVGMSRSTDGGKSWSAMRTVMDMGAPHENNGVGDPSILFDPVTKTIWVAALWSKGNRSIAGSGPGLTPDETGQIVLIHSTDDGQSWTKPYSITAQVKDPAWRIFFPGPGNGIAMEDGKIVFPAQYWDAQKMPHATLIYSADHGKSWKRGTGAKSNTTESQLIETTPGRLMLNMRDNRGKFRSVATTTDMGQSWVTHPTSYNTLADPVCMGSFIKARFNIKGVMRDVVLFSNPNVSAGPRKDLTIKASMDLGETWLPAHQLLLDDRKSFGYSALTKIDDHTIGVLYEGVSSLLFVRIPVENVVK